jgi:hypothetical protein
VTDAVQLVAIATSLLLLAVVLDLVRRRMLTEEYSFIWLTCAAAMLVLSIWRDILHVAARALEVHYPPALLLLVLILFAFAASLYFSIVVSRQRQQIERLMEEVALLDAEIRESAARGVPPRAAREPADTTDSAEIRHATNPEFTRVDHERADGFTAVTKTTASTKKNSQDSS